MNSGQCVQQGPDKSRGGLWISGIEFAQNEKELRKNGIGAVLSAASLDLHLPSDFKILTFDLDDCETQKISQHFDEAFNFIEASLKATNVLVHCAAGISRSTAMLTSYLMRKRRISFDNALAIVKAKRSCVCPNSGFQQQLRAYEVKLGV